MLIFDYEDGDLIHTVSDNMAVDFDGNLMMNLEPSFPLAQCRKVPMRQSASWSGSRPLTAVC